MDTARSPTPDAPGDSMTAEDIAGGIILVVGGYCMTVLAFCL